MWAITLKQNKKKSGIGKKILGSVQLKFALTYIALIIALLLLLNIYPLTVSRDLVRTAKDSALSTQALSISQTLGTSDTLSYEGVSWAMGHINISNLERFLVKDESGAVIYDTAGGQDDLFETFPDFRHALSTNEVFHSCLSDGNFSSWFAMPVMHGSQVIGAVFLHELDPAGGALIEGIGRNLRNISILVFVVALLVAIFFSHTLTVRLTEMLSAMRRVGRGEYSYKLEPKGSDEVAKLGDAFNSLTERLEETEEMRRRFVSDASHELKTPLASIQLLSDSIVQSADMDEKTVREFVEDIGQEAERLSRTTEKLLRLTRLDVAPVVARTAVDMKFVVRRVGHMLKPLADERGVSIHYHLAEDCAVIATEDDIYQIVFNLGENAIKYTARGGNVWFHLEKQEDRVILKVEDDGIGIPEEDMPHIFERFYRVDKARSRDKGGAGLGLSIVRDTAEQHGGYVEVFSKEKGTLVAVTFVQKEDEEERK